MIVKGIQTPGGNEERNILYISVNHEGNEYDWQVFIPVGESIDDFLERNEEKIHAEIEAKEQEWEALDPKTRDMTTPDGEVITVPITKSEIIRPEDPDYYAERRSRYPSQSEQLDAFWKGPESQEYHEMMDRIKQIKEQFPKPEWAITYEEPNPVPFKVSALQARLALANIGLLDSVQSIISGSPQNIQLAWEYAIEFQRNSPTILALASELGLSEEQLDDLFIAAVQIRI